MRPDSPPPAAAWRPLPLSLGALGGLLRADERGAAVWNAGGILEQDWGAEAPSSRRRLACAAAAGSDDLRLLVALTPSGLAVFSRNECAPSPSPPPQSPLAADPQGRWFAFADAEGAVLVASPGGDLLLRWRPPGGPAALVALAPSPDGDLLACSWELRPGGLVASLRLDPPRLGQVAALSEPPRPCRSLAFGPGGLLAAAVGRSILVYGPGGDLAGQLDEQPGDPSALAVSGRHVAVGYRGGPLALWNIPTHGGRGGYAGGFDGHSRTVRGARFVAQGTGLATAGDDQQVALWELPATQPRRGFAAGTAPIEAMAQGPAGRALLLGHGDGGASLVNAIDGSIDRKVGHHAGGTFAVAWSPSGGLWATGGADGRALLWGRGGLRGEALARGQAQSLAFDARGAAVLVADEGGVGRFKLPLGAVASSLARFTPPRQAARLPGAAGPCNAVAIRGETAAAASADGLVHLGKIDGFHTTMVAHPGRAWCLAFSPAEPLLACGGDGGVALLDPRHGERLLRLALDGGRAWAVGFSPDGSRLAVACEDGAVRLLDLASGKVTDELRGHTRAAVGVDWRPDGLFSAGRDGLILRWSRRPP